MRGRRHAANSRTTSKLRRKVAASSGTPHSGTRSSGQMVHNMDKCHNLSVPCSSAVRDVLCDIFPELSGKLSCEQSLLGQIIRKYLLEEKDKRLCATHDPIQSKKKRRKKKKKTTESIVEQNVMKDPLSSFTIDNNEKHQHKPLVIHTRKLDLFIEKLPTLNKKVTNEEYQHHCVQIKAPPDSRDLSALLQFIRCQYQEFKNSNRPTSKSRPILGVSEIPTISHQKLQSLCERIQCQSCRNDTLCSLNETPSVRKSSGPESSPLENIEDKKKLNTFVLNAAAVAIPDPATKSWLAVPVTSLNHDRDNIAHDVDRAFDYVGMEEGYESCLSAIRDTKIKDSIDLHDDELQLNFVMARDGSGERFVQLQPLGGPDQTNSFPFSIMDVDGIIRHIIIPCGLAELEQQNEDKISPEKITLMRKDACEMVESLADNLNDLTKKFAAIQSLLHEVTGPIAPFAPSVSKKLRECDSRCEMYMGDVMEFLISFHRSTSAARCAIHLDQKWLKGIDEKLWVGYETAIQSLIEPSTNHRWKVIQLQGNRTNVLPPMYNSKEQRTYIQEMIEEKLKILSQLNDMLDQVLVSPSSEEGCTGDSTNLKRIVAHAVYFSHNYVEERCKDTLNNVFDYKSLLSSRSASVCKTIHETKVLDVLEIQSKRIESMRSQAKLLVENMEAHSEAIIIKLPQKYESLWKANNILIEERTIGDDKFSKCAKAQASLESEKNELRDSCCLVGDVGRQCRLLEDLKTVDLNQSDNNTVKKPFTPGHSENLDGGQIVFTIFGNEESQSQTSEKCDGGGGRRRVTSIISACIYSWLQDRCMEWHADLTQKELLSAVEDEPSSVNGMIPRTKKSSKKKKDKRKTDAKKLSCIIVETDTEPFEKEKIGAKECISNTVGSDEHDSTDDSLFVVRETSKLSGNIRCENEKKSDLCQNENLLSNVLIDSRPRNISGKEIVHSIVGKKKNFSGTSA